MFNELSLVQVNSIADAQKILETFIKATIRASALGFTEMRLYENVLENLFQLDLFDGYRIDVWLNDRSVNSDLKLRFREIIANPPLLNEDDFKEKEFYEWSIFHLDIDSMKCQVYGLGAAYIFGTLSISLSTHQAWNKTSLSINHYTLTIEGNESNSSVDVPHFSTIENLNFHEQWIEKEQKKSLENSQEMWNKREEHFPFILFGSDVESQINRLGLSKKFYRVFDCLKKLNAYSTTWVEGGFNLNHLKLSSLLDISGESDCTMKKYFVTRKFRLSNGQKAQFELHIKIPDLRIYFLPNDSTHEITVGYIGKHLPTCLFD